ncbi:TIGR01459 family HAD-type hydrolase [Kumtagia ephedrae]|uniref:TIGR01459 family HAD-type hydrolase n=1 Tax=Kumtagia ephedrae TaxID=2116701 RepID=A0A2P7SF59_9HYPH|nr:TIGR01459 family HAD-type hydrolase [Mesorhizobium ephedrae]PSJ61097.1 TIGR01459 family HAD-type hydrolase [Mesorhizobium ephedrae]
MVKFVGSLQDIAASYSVLLCDVWGVVHNGVRPFDDAVAALIEARQKGAAVILVTNSPRLTAGVTRQIQGIGVPDTAWDRIVTSGDVTRELIRHGPRRVCHIGPDREESIFDGLDVEVVEEWEAAAVVCTGLHDDESETPEDYAEQLRRLRSRDLPMICANPDLVAERGHKMVFCAGALARDYALLGGRTLIAGKPHRPIYDAALEAAAEVLGGPVSAGDALAIGDGMLTDVKGAADYGIDVLYVSAGIHAADYGDPDRPDPERLAAFLAHHGQAPVAVMPRLR